MLVGEKEKFLFWSELFRRSLVYNTPIDVYLVSVIMRTNIVLDDELVKEATMLTGISTKRELIDIALRELIRCKRKRNLFDLAGKIEFADDFDYKSNRGLRHGTD